MFKQYLSTVKNHIFHHVIRESILSNKEILSHGIYQIPIQKIGSERKEIPIHIAKKANPYHKLSNNIILALGGIHNIASYQPIPNSRRIRITLHNPKLINISQLKNFDLKMFVRIGKHIVHIIP